MITNLPTLIIVYLIKQLVGSETKKTLKNFTSEKQCLDQCLFTFSKKD